MDQSNNQPSFVPKSPSIMPSATSYIPETRTLRQKTSLFGVVGVIIFVAAIVACVSLFGYKFYLNSQISQMSSALESARQTLEPDTIAQLTRIDSRLDTTKGLVTKHISLSALFDLLEANTLQAVRFSDFSYNSDQQGISLSMQGSARGYTPLALQSDTFEKIKTFRSPTFTNFALDQKGNVTFTFSAGVDPNLVSYNAAFAGQTVAPSTAPVGTTTPAQSATTTVTTSANATTQ